MDSKTTVEPKAEDEVLKQVQAVTAAIQTLKAIVPNWSRKERRALANAIRLGGRGYTK